MLKAKTTSTTNGNGTAQRMPKASDFKLPKRLSAAAKRRIETTQVILEAFRKVREGETNPEK